MTYPEHIQWIINNRGEALTRALSKDNSYKIMNNPFSVFLDADPTSKKKLTQWSVDTYISGGFKWEDIQSGSNSKVFDTLSLYVKHKSKLDSANHIGQYDTLGSVYKDIAPFIKSDKSSRSVKRDEQVQAYEESEILIKSNAGEFTKNSLTVVIPKTEYASKWWGKGTQWCTAGDKNNAFHRYYKNGPLIIIIINGVKTQLYINLVNKDHNIQFMDEHDNKVKLKFIEDNWNLLSPIIKWVIAKNGNTLRFVPEKLRTEELCLEAVRQNGYALSSVPEPLRTAELCLVAIRQNGINLSSVPEPLRTAELCLVAIRQNGINLSWVPELLRTVELYLEAVKQNGWALRYVPEHFKTAELCLEAVRQNGYSLFCIPIPLRTAELCLEAVRKDGGSLRYIPEYLKTFELCSKAVKQSGGALKYVPENFISQDIYLNAVRANGWALGYIPESLRTAELCLEAVRQNGEALRYVPEILITLELCLEAVNQNIDSLEYVPKKYIAQMTISFKISWDFNITEELKLQLEDNYLKMDKINYNKIIW